PCGSGREPLAGVWGEAERASVIAHARSLDPMLGEPRAITAAAGLDAYTRAWSEMRLQSCRATHVDGTQSDTLLDLRTPCLDHRLDEVRGTVALPEEASDRAALDAADVAATQLTPLDGCADAAALTAALPPPEDPGKRASVAALEKEVLAIELGRRSGQ